MVKKQLILLKIVFLTIINLWLIYSISTRIELEKICITSDWLNHIMYFLEIENPTINVQLFVLFGVFVIFCIVFGIVIKLIKSVRIGVSILMVFMSKYLYKVHDKFLTCGEDINILGITMEHVMSIKEKLTLLKDYIKNNNIMIDNQDFIVIWDAIKPLKKLDEVKETIEQLVEALKGKELSTIEYVYSLLTIQNIMITVAGLTIVAGLIYIGHLKYSNILNKRFDANFNVNFPSKFNKKFDEKFHDNFSQKFDSKINDMFKDIATTQDLNDLNHKLENSMEHSNKILETKMECVRNTNKIDIHIIREAVNKLKNHNEKIIFNNERLFKKIEFLGL